MPTPPPPALRSRQALPAREGGLLKRARPAFARHSVLFGLFPAPARLLLLGLLLGLSAPARAGDVVISSEARGEETISLGFIDFGGAKVEGLNPGAILSEDLLYSGRFQVKNAPRFDSTVKAGWIAANTMAYVAGDLRQEGGKVTLECRLLDTETGELVIGKKYDTNKEGLRLAAHKFADELVQQLFGEKGIAQTRIAYITRRSGNKELAVMDYDGAGARDLTQNRAINLSPCFIEGRSKILFTSYASGFPQLHFKEVESGKSGILFKSKGMNTAAAFNRMDKEIAFASTVDGNSEIYRRTVAEGKPVRLTFSGSIDTSPSWSPNGYEIVFVSDRSGNPMLYVMDRDGSNVRRIVYEGNYYGSPAWSPKGDRIAFTALNPDNTMDVFTVRPDGSEMARLTQGQGTNEDPTWSPDGRHIAFSSTRAGKADIWVMRANGANARRLTFSGGNSSPRWSE